MKKSNYIPLSQTLLNHPHKCRSLKKYEYKKLSKLNLVLIYILQVDIRADFVST